MITNPTVGMKVIWIGSHLEMGIAYGTHGTITMLRRYSNVYPVLVNFGPISSDLPCSLNELAPLELSPEQEAIHQEQLRQIEDQQRRQAHANKYL